MFYNKKHVSCLLLKIYFFVVSFTIEKKLLDILYNLRLVEEVITDLITNLKCL